MTNTSGDVLSFPRQHAATRRFSLGTPRNFAISADGSAVLFLRSKHGRDPVLCLWALDVATSSERLIVDPSALGNDGAELSAAERARRERARESASGIVRFSTDAAFRHAVMEVAGAIVVVDLTTDSIHTIAAADGLFDARIDPTGRRCAYVAKRSLRVIDLETGTDTELAAETDPAVSWGRADFIAGEEMGRTRGFWWAPNGSGLLVCRVADHDVARWWIADPANPGVEPNEIRYPAAGTANTNVTLHHFALNGERTNISWDDPVGDLRFEYLADVVWTEGHEPVVVRQPRNQRAVSIATVDVSSGAVTEQQRITDPTWVELIPGSPALVEAGLLTVEDRTHLDRRVLCLDGQPVSGDDINVRSIVHASGDSVMVTAWTEPTQIHVATIDLRTPRARARFVTSDPGVHHAVSNGSVAVVVSATPNQPAPTISVHVEGVHSASISTMLDPPVLTARPEFVKLGDRRLSAALFVPEGHDGSSPLPVLLDPYGGPHAQRVLENHLGHLTSQWFANQGFAVLVVDNRGAPGRGPAFEREVWGDLASPALEDQLDALDAALERYAFLDRDRVGIRGWSFGGYLAALAALRAPDRIHAAIAGAPVTNWRLYDTHYTERYLGHPDEHPEHYERSGLSSDADQLTRPLLLIHGLADDNVVAAHTLQFSSALLAAGRAHSVLPLSGVTHMTPQEIVAENLLHLQRDFLIEHLAATTAAK